MPVGRGREVGCGDKREPKAPSSQNTSMLAPMTVLMTSKVGPMAWKPFFPQEKKKVKVKTRRETEREREMKVSSLTNLGCC